MPGSGEDDLGGPEAAVRREAPIRPADPADEAHRATAEGDNERVVETEEEIDQLAAELWGLTDKELADIKRSLEELL